MRRLALLLLLTALTACKGHEFHPPDKAKQVAQADSMYSPALFDTIQWRSENERLQIGNEVYARKCDRCHGVTGEGGTDYAREQNLKVPSLVGRELTVGEDHNAVRHKIFTGHRGGMPIWGVAGITPREIDAVTSYVLDQLRSE